MSSPRRESDVCVLCTEGEATTDDHIPAKLFFDPPPENLITVPACRGCNKGAQHDDEYLRAFLMLLRDSSPSEAMERVRERTVRHLHRPSYGGLLRRFEESSELRREPFGEDGQVALGLYTRPERERLWKSLTRYVRGLYFWSTGTMVPKDAVLSVERIFNRSTRPDEYWEPMLAAAEYAKEGTVVTVGTDAEFQYSFRAISEGHAMAVMVLDFYRSFPYAAVIMKPGTVLPGPVIVPY